MIKNQTLLLVDDEKDILDFLSYNLKKEGFHIHTASNGLEAIEVAQKINPALILLDVMMPKMDGIETCQYLRNDLKMEDCIIVFLTSRSEDYSQVAGFEAGADDYINKPIRPRLLVSKVQSLLRRMERLQTGNKTTTQSLIINRDKYVAELNGEDINLPKKEFELLELLASRPGKVFTREQIMTNVWGNETIVGERTIDVHIRKLREKLGDTYIRTMKGVGYTFSES
ncbi:MAG: response regulator transcription factor [Crocinitomicaceae bacterium]|nr:response regulator transcription factor [Crocinitomicaceae bacterium]